MLEGTQYEAMRRTMRPEAKLRGFFHYLQTLRNRGGLRPLGADELLPIFAAREDGEHLNAVVRAVFDGETGTLHIGVTGTGLGDSGRVLILSTGIRERLDGRPLTDIVSTLARTGPHDAKCGDEAFTLAQICAAAPEIELPLVRQAADERSGTVSFSLPAATSVTCRAMRELLPTGLSLWLIVSKA